MESFAESAPGRLMTIAFALPLAVGVYATLQGDRLDVLAITAALFSCIVLVTVGAAIAMEERPKHALAAILGLPPALLLYLPLLALAGEAPIIRLTMGVAALVLVGSLAKGAVSSLRHHAERAGHVAPHPT